MDFGPIGGESAGEGLAAIGVNARGHSSTKITLDIYSHVTKELGDEAADRIARSILGGEQ
jgi:hypothetical protein